MSFHAFGQCFQNGKSELFGVARTLLIADMGHNFSIDSNDKIDFIFQAVQQIDI